MPGASAWPDPWCDHCPLRRAPGLAEFASHEIAFMVSFKAEHRRVPAGGEVFRQGTLPTHLYTLFRGWAYSARTLGGRRRQILSVMLPGDLAGAAGVASERHHYSLFAATDAEFCCLDLKRVAEMLRTREGLARRLVWLLHKRIREADRRLLELGCCSAEQALAYFVLDLRARLHRCGLLEPEGHSFELPLSQAEIADYLGVTVVHLNRLLGRLQAEGMLVLRRRRAEIRDIEGLRSRACQDDWHEPDGAVAQPFL